MSTNSITKESIRFSNNQQSTLVFAGAGASPANIIKELEIKDYKAVILILGGADSIEEKLKPRLTQLFDRGIARAAAEASAVIIDGGTQAGVMSLMGAGVASRGHTSTLIGVAPANLVSYPGSKTTTGFQLEPNHSHFVLVEGDIWSSKTDMMLSLVKNLSDKTNKGTGNTSSTQGEEKLAEPSPTLAILAGGGATTKNEVLYAVRQNLPLIIFEGSGGMADEIVEAWNKKDTSPEDPLMAEIVEEGNLHFYALNSPVKGIERLIIRELGIDKVLVQAWETFADYDHNAILQQKRFDKLQMSIIFLGVVGTALAIIQQVFAVRDADKALIFPWNVIHYILILIPILLTVLITAANRFKQGTKWLLLRAGAESIKREIYRYRTKAMYYKDDPEQQLSKKVEDITLRTMRTEVNLSSLKPYDKQKGFPPYMFASKGGDDGFTSLTPDRYVEVRLGDQLNYFKKSALKLDIQLTRLYWLIFLIGGIGSFLAAIDYQIWIALTTAVVAACGTYLGYRQTENTLTKYNQAATDLVNIKTWWNALSSEEQAQQLNIDSLVEHTEQVLQSELDGWIQQMQNALAELRKGQDAQLTEKEEKKEPEEVLKTKPGTEKNNNKAIDDKVVPDKDKTVEEPKATEAGETRNAAETQNTAETKEPETQDMPEPEEPQPGAPGSADDDQDGKDRVAVIPPPVNEQEDEAPGPEENKS